MESTSLNKSVSESDINLLESGVKTPPPNYVFQRVKRSREEISMCEQLEEFKKEIREMMTLFSNNREQEIHQINLTLKNIQQTNLKIEQSIQFVAAQNEELQKKVDSLETQTKEDKKYITLLENKLEDLQIGTRKTNFVLKNVPKRNNETKEDLIEMVMCLSQSINCTINKYDIKDIYRVRGKNAEIQKSPIVVETASTLLKAEIMKMGKAYNLKHQSKLCCKHLGFKTQEDTPFFLSDHLTPKGSRLHFLARDLANSGAFKFCWTAYGRVYLRKDEQSPTVTVTSEEQVHHLSMQK